MLPHSQHGDSRRKGVRDTVKTIYLGKPQDDLWTVCDPDDPVPAGKHMHKCHSCNTAWTHGNDLPNEQLTSTEFDMAHSCPRCGREETLKYRVNERDLINAAIEMGVPDPALIVRSVLERFNRAYQRGA